MLRQILILTIILLTSCGQNEKSNKHVDNNSDEEQTMVLTEENKVKNALTFINGYNENCNKMKEAIGTIEWVNSNSLATNSFKTELKKIIDDAYKEDPELGLGADPIFDAQDNPIKGLELESFDDKTNYLIVKGKNWPEFKLTMKVKEENGMWLVEGCGMVNIPNDKRTER